AVLAGLEKTEDALVFATGMAAISTAVLSVVQAGDHVITQHSLYSGAMLFFRNFLSQYGVTVTHVDQKDNAAFAAAIQQNTKLISVATTCNLNLEITDLKYLRDLRKQHPIIPIVDNTFAPPVNQTPRDFGTGIIVHSAKKHLGGHSD